LVARGVLHDGPAAYSCLTRLPDGTVGCLYESGDLIGRPYDGPIFSRFDLGWLTGG
jgi:sialidase-1